MFTVRRQAVVRQGLRMRFECTCRCAARSRVRGSSVWSLRWCLHGYAWRALGRRPARKGGRGGAEQSPHLPPGVPTPGPSPSTASSPAGLLRGSPSLSPDRPEPRRSSRQRRLRLHPHPPTQPSQCVASPRQWRDGTLSTAPTWIPFIYFIMIWVFRSGFAKVGRESWESYLRRRARGAAPGGSVPAIPKRNLF